MTWSVIRKATPGDREALETAALRFCKRHGIDPDVSAVESVEWATRSDPPYQDEDKARRLRPLWRRIVRRILDSKNATGIAYGCVGFNVD